MSEQAKGWTAATALAIAALLGAGPATAQARTEIVRPEARPGGPMGLPTASAVGPEAEQAVEWASSAWAYFAHPPAEAPVPAEGAGAAPPPPPEAVFLTPLRSKAPFATAWSIGDEVAALVLARRLGMIEPAEFDRRFSRVVDFLHWMPLAMGELPNRFYDPVTGAALGGDLRPGEAGWSAVDTGRLLLWLRIAAVEHPEFAPFIRSGVARLSVCHVAAPGGGLVAAVPGPDGPTYAPEAWRGYDVVAAQGYRAWGLDLPLPAPTEPSAEVEIEGLRFPVREDLAAQAPVMTAPPAYLGLELGFEPIGGAMEEVAGGRAASDLLDALRSVQVARLGGGQPVARTDYLLERDPYEVRDAVLADGVPWSTLAGESVRPDLALISVRAVFALDAFYEDAAVGRLMDVVRDLRDPEAGWYEGRYEATGGWEVTRSSATNAFVLEAMAYRATGPLLPPGARPATLRPAVPGEGGACRLPLAVATP